MIQSTVSPESGISMAQVNYYNFGESSNVAMANTFRQNWLDAGRPSANKFVTPERRRGRTDDCEPFAWRIAPAVEPEHERLHIDGLTRGHEHRLHAALRFQPGRQRRGRDSGCHLSRLAAIPVPPPSTRPLTGLIGNTRPPIWLQNVVDGYQLTNGPDTNGVAMPVTARTGGLLRASADLPIRPDQLSSE